MARRKEPVLILVGLFVFALVSTSSAVSPRRGHRPRVTPGFFGVVYDKSLTEGTMSLGGQAGLMHRAGAQTVGLAFNWADAQPSPPGTGVRDGSRAHLAVVDGIPTNFARTDREITAAARAGLRVLPTVVLAPSWGALDPGRPWSPPRAPPYADYCAALAARYGPHGSFWRRHRHLPRMPIRTWQIWNEPTSGFPRFPSVFWNDDRPFAPRYLRILHLAHDAIQAHDPHARVLIAGLIGRSWRTMSRLYKLGGRRWFDGVALHPYTNRVEDVVRTLRLVRAVMNRHGDRRKPLAITELGFPAYLPWRKHDAKRFTDPVRLYPLQASWLGSTLERLYRLRHRLNIATVLWFAWATSDTYRPAKQINAGFSYMGLVHRTTTGRVRRKPALYAYYYVAHHLRARYRHRRAGVRLAAPPGLR